MLNSAPILSASEYLALPREAETFLLKPLLPSGGAMLLYGDPKVGKSYAAIQLALALSQAQGGNFLGFPVTQAGKVVYVQLDTPRSLWAKRLEELKLSGLPIELLYLADRETLQTWPFDILNPEHQILLQAALAPYNPTAVIIDTLRECHSGDEDKSTAMQPVIAKLVAATQPAALILISHARKPNSDGILDLMADNRGSSYVPGRMDAICRMTKKGFHYTGRAIEEGHIKISRLDNGLWESADQELANAVDRVLADTTLTSERQQAEVLSEMTGKTLEASRSTLRRRRA